MNEKSITEMEIEELIENYFVYELSMYTVESICCLLKELLFIPYHPGVLLALHFSSG